jgi:short-subunit dehydrogenase
MPLKKSVLITGCSNGIGLAVAKGLQNEFHVIATARKLDDVKSLTESGFDAVQLDLTNEQSIEVGFQKVLALTDGKIYGLFHNAGYAQIGAIEELPTKALIEQFQINFFSWHHLTRLVMPIMREQNEGRIIFNSSCLGLWRSSLMGLIQRQNMHWKVMPIPYVTSFILVN